MQAIRDIIGVFVQLTLATGVVALAFCAVAIWMAIICLIGWNVGLMIGPRLSWLFY